MRGRKPQLVLGVVVALAIFVALVTASSAAGTPSVRVYFLRGEQLATVERPGRTPDDALRALLAGPTVAETKRTFRSYVPKKTPVRSLQVQQGVATVDLGSRFASAGSKQTLLARLSQLVGTLTAVKGIASVQLLIDGKRVSGVFPGVPTGSPITFKYLQTPNAPAPREPKPKLGPFDRHLKQVQQKLIQLSYLVAGDADGRFGPTTATGILAFQKWEGLKRSGALDVATEARLAKATRPVPLTHGAAGRRAEVLIDRQVTLLISGNNVVRTIAVSTGKPSTPTPPGNYRVYAKITRWWSVPFREWLPWAVPFVGGIAFHEFPIVPVYAASHGCVRQAVPVARWTYDFASVGMPVKVIARS